MSIIVNGSGGGLDQIAQVVDENYTYAGAILDAQAAYQQFQTTHSASDAMAAYSAFEKLNQACTCRADFTMGPTAQKLMSDLKAWPIALQNPFPGAQIQITTGKDSKEHVVTLGEIMEDSSMSCDYTQKGNIQGMNSTNWVQFPPGSNNNAAPAPGITFQYCDDNKAITGTATGAALLQYGLLDTSHLQGVAAEALFSDDASALLNAQW